MTINKIKVQGTSYDIVPSQVADANGNVITIPAGTTFTGNSWYKFTLNGKTLGTTNGTSLGTAYAPTSAGTSGQVLVSGGDNVAPVWTDTSTIGGGSNTNKYSVVVTGNGTNTVTITYNGNTYAAGSIIEVPSSTTITASNITATAIEDYECNITVSGLIINVAYNSTEFAVGDVVWAKGNIVKNSNGTYSIGNPTDTGAYFAWADVTGYNRSQSHSFNETNYNSTVVSGSNTLNNLQYSFTSSGPRDAARVNLQTPWRMPSKEDFELLMNECYMSWQDNYNSSGVAGCLFTLKTDRSKKLFFPAAGYAQGGSSVDYYNDAFGCWTTTIDNSDKEKAYVFFGYYDMQIMSEYRYSGFTIRPIKDNVD